MLSVMEMRKKEIQFLERRIERLQKELQQSDELKRLKIQLKGLKNV